MAISERLATSRVCILTQSRPFTRRFDHNSAEAPCAATRSAQDHVRLSQTLVDSRGSGKRLAGHEDLPTWPVTRYVHVLSRADPEPERLARRRLSGEMMV